MLKREKVVLLLAEFFMDAFGDDPAGVAAYFDESSNDFDAIYEAVKKIREGGL